VNLSIAQALDVWADLEDAYQGVHGFGSDTAEVYAYRLRPEQPARGSDYPPIVEDCARHDRQAAAALRELAALFEERRECRVLVVRGRRDDGIPIAEWSGPLDHRVHVRVVR
jgi:hypothetical protein